MRRAEPEVSWATHRLHNALLAGALAATILTGCQNGSSPTDQKATPTVTATTTPKQARDALRTDLVAVAEAAMPGQKAAVNQGIGDLVPCGGPAGTDRSKLISSVEVVIGNPAEMRPPTEVLDATRRALEARGWKVQHSGHTGTRYTLRATSTDGAGVTVIHEPTNKSLQLLGETACLPNPDS